MLTRSYLSTTTLNRNGLNTPIKRQDWVNAYKNILSEKKKKTLLITRDTYRLKVMARKKPFCENGEQKKLGGAILI